MRHLGEAKIRQEAAFWAGEGDAWHRRNLGRWINYAVVAAIINLNIKPEKILEIGCGAGKYLDALHQTYDCTCVGVDPSGEAIAYGREHYPDLKLHLGTVETAYTMFRGEEFDLIIFGFCLYVMDRDGLFDIVASTDVLLKENGYIAIHDFHPRAPYVLPYHHKEGLFSYKMRYADLWLANPAYEWISETSTAPGEAITIIKKGSWGRWQV